jgi:single-strand DNA-binding protein
MSLPVITVVGNLVADPEVKFFSSGDAYVNFSVAVGTRKKDADGNWADGETSYFDATVVGTTAENLANSLNKGTRVIITGAQSQREYVDKDGNTRRAYSIKVDSLGADLRWATAVVTKTTKSGDGSATAARRPAAAQNSFDEEPF